MQTRAERRRKQRQYKDEKVYCISSNLLTDIENGYNKTAIKPKDIWNFFDNKGMYLLRSDVEGLNLVYQLLSLIVCTTKDNKILTYTDKDNNIKLFNFTHIAENICGTNNMLLKSIFHLSKMDKYKLDLNKPVIFDGFIKTFDEDYKGHLGVIFKTDELVDLSLFKDIKDIEVKYMSHEELSNSYGKLDSWSKEVLNYLYEPVTNK